MWNLIIIGIIMAESVQGDSEVLLQENLNNQPIIGILAQQLSISINEKFNQEGKYSSYIAASYVKWIESAGGRVVPVWINKNEDYYINVLQKVNGLLFPGGGIDFEPLDQGYFAAGEKLYQKAWEYDVPIWGTCLGYELLMYAAAKEKGHGDPREECNSYNRALPLILKPDFNQSRLFNSTPKCIIQSLETKEVTADFHHKCITEQRLEKLKLNTYWKVISVNDDVNGLRFISTIESKTRPYYGVQFHPEKNIFEFKANKAQPHTFEAIQVAQYFANFFINQARKNKNQYMNVEDDIIYNYIPTYTGRNLSYAQIYFFEK